ncbi:MAG: ArsR family transcriptional regulator [Rhodocyclales bacterium]|nr:ArsR family transcriptional regulator [Rhodocyclales bacterium]
MNALILNFLKTNGEGLDADIAKALHLPVSLVKTQVSQLSSAGEVICCKVTRYVDGKKIEGISCRLSGNLPTPARGPKPGAKREAGPGKKVA